VGDIDRLGPFAERLAALAEADSQRAAAEADEELKARQFEVAVVEYVADRMPSGQFGDDEQTALTATLERIARAFLQGQASTLFEGRGRFTLEEFRSERRRLIERLVLLEAEASLIRRGTAAGNLDRYQVSALAKVRFAKESRTGRKRPLQYFQGRIADAEADHLDARVSSLGQSRVFPSTNPVGEVRVPHGERRQDSRDRKSVPPVHAGPTSEKRQRPYTIRDLDPVSTRARFREILALADQGFSSKRIAAKFTEAPSTIRTWLGRARSMRASGEL